MHSIKIMKVKKLSFMYKPRLEKPLKRQTHSQNNFRSTRNIGLSDQCALSALRNSIICVANSIGDGIRTKGGLSITIFFYLFCAVVA